MHSPNPDSGEEYFHTNFVPFDEGAKFTPEVVLPFLRDIAGHFFPLLAGDAKGAG